MKKQLLIVAIAGLSVIAPARAINIADLIAQGQALQNDVVQKVVPVAQELVSNVVKGDFNALEKYLQANIGKLDLQPALNFVQSNLPQIKGFLTDALKDESTFNSIKGQLPSEYQGKVSEARTLLLNNIDRLDQVNQHLNSIKGNLNISTHIPTVMNALRSIAASPEYASFRPELNAFYNNQLKPFADAVQKINFNKIANAANEIAKKLQGQQFNALVVIPGVGETRRALPNIIGLINNVVVLVLKLDSQLKNSGTQLPGAVSSALNAIADNSSEVFKTIQNLNQQIDKALGK